MHAKHDEPWPTIITLFCGVNPHLPFHFPNPTTHNRACETFVPPSAVIAMGVLWGSLALPIADYLPLLILGSRPWLGLTERSLAGLPLLTSEICSTMI